MNTGKNETVRLLFAQCIDAFRSAFQGPDPQGPDQDAPVMSGYTILMKGHALYLAGWTDGHPRLGSTFATTSLLIHITNDETWGRTKSRWYRLQDPYPVDLPLVHTAAVASRQPGPIMLPLDMARQVMNQRPANLARMARDEGFAELADELSDIARIWPPQH